MKLSTALRTLIKEQAMNFVKVKVIQQTVLATMFAALSPIALLKIGSIIGTYI